MATFISNSMGRSKWYRFKNIELIQAFIFIVSHYFNFEWKTKVRKAESGLLLVDYKYFLHEKWFIITVESTR